MKGRRLGVDFGERVRQMKPGEVAEIDRETLADYDRMWDGCGCKIDYFE
jgi:hypothetical protein